MNRKGVISLGLLFVIGLVAMSGAAFVLTPNQITRKANDKCIRGGGSAGACKSTVDNMTPAQAKEYIRDTVAHPQPMDEPLGG